MFEEKNLIYSDGGSKGNPGPGGYGVIVAMPTRGVVELGGRSPATTNNKMELQGVIEGLNYIKNHCPSDEVVVITDSSYVIQGITTWIFGWIKRGWRTMDGKDVANKDQWETLHSLVASINKSKGKIIWRHVRGHRGIPGNERVDEIANAFSDNKDANLYEGVLSSYNVPIYDITDSQLTKPEDLKSPSQKTSKKKPYSYLSFINNKLERHKTWAECEARVKGRAGARFKKALSEADEKKIISEWGANS